MSCEFVLCHVVVEVSSDRRKRFGHDEKRISMMRAGLLRECGTQEPRMFSSRRKWVKLVLESEPDVMFSENIDQAMDIGI